MRTRTDEGQATVELALALPVVVAIALLIVQVVLVGRDQLLVAHAARVAAREAAVDQNHDHKHVHRAAVRSAPALKPARVSTETSYQGGPPGMVIVRVRYAASTDVPLVGPLLPDLTLTAIAAMRDETDKEGRSVVSEVEKHAGLASSRTESHV